MRRPVLSNVTASMPGERRVTKGRAKLAMGQGLSVWVLDVADGFGDAGLHSHHAIQITFCLQGTLKLANARERVSGPIIAVAADAVHRIEAEGLLAFVFVEPESRLGRDLTERFFRDGELVAVDEPDLNSLVEPLRSTFDAARDVSTLLDVGRAVAGRLAPGTAATMPDPRVQRIMDYAAAHLDEPLSLTGAAHGVYLSPSRLRHLFVEQTGLAFRTYLLWLRLVRAVQLYSEGRSLTEAAHGAGFSDSAHFSRVFRRTFGLPATALTRI